MQIRSFETVRPSTLIGILIGLLATGTATWIVVQTASDYQESTHPRFSSAAAFVDQLDSEPSIATNNPDEPDSGVFVPGDIDPAGLDNGDTGPTPTTEPPAPNPEPTTPTTQPNPPKKTPDTTAPPPPNEAPTVDELKVHSEGGRLTVKAHVTDPEAEIVSIKMILSEGNRVLGLRTIAPEPGASSQTLDGDFTIDTTKTPRRMIDVTVEVVDRPGAKASKVAEHEVVRRTKVWVSPVNMSIDANSTCFDVTPALSLTGQVTVAGTGIDASSNLGGEFRADKLSMTLLNEQVGFVDGDKAWFMLVTVSPDLVTPIKQTINLGKIQALHSQVGSFVQTFDKKGCSGAITYTITAELL